ncbi:MAG: ABC transporter ATP-binding protein [Nitrososphaerales archaeon]|jgi:ABC-2 type transport system ATP-binding protein
MVGEMIEAEGIRHTYDGKKYALDGVSFSVGKGEVFGLLGKNGAGKSTLIKALTTLIRPTSGRLRIMGMDPEHEGRKIRSRIGVVQQGESFDFTTVQGNFDVYGILWGVPKQERVRRREELIKKFGLEPIRKQRSFDLSGGQKRRVQVAREMMHDMDVLFLDEPTVGLDVMMRRELLDSIKREVIKGLTVVFTTHNLEEADYLCDRIAVIDQGRILAMDTVENLKTRYGGRKAVEVTLAGGDLSGFFGALGERLGGDASVKSSGSSAVILVSDPKAALQTIIDLSQSRGLQIEWLNVRKNTLEDVFIDSVTRVGQGERGDGDGGAMTATTTAG